jgi:hypothetical protein
MSASAYARVARLATHPAFQPDGRLHCPRGCESFERVSEYDRHVLSHDLGAREAWGCLSGRTYEREQPRRGWPEAAEAMTLFEGEERQ